MSTSKAENLKLLGTRDVCRFCEIGDRAENKWFNAPLAETENFVAIPSLGSLVPGWVVILPREHSWNFSEHYTSAELESFLDEVRFGLSGFEGHIHVFEHGAQMKGSATGCGVDHAHVHIVPLPDRLSSVVGDVDPDLEWILVPENEIAGVTQGLEYLAFAENNDRAERELRVARLDLPRSQFFRRSIATMLGIPDKFNYREHGFYENVQRTYDAFRRNRTERRIAV